MQDIYKKGLLPLSLFILVLWGPFLRPFSACPGLSGQRIQLVVAFLPEGRRT